MLAILFASFSVSERSGAGGPVYEWSVGAFEPWLERWHPDPGPGASGGIALNVVSTSFACGIGAVLALAVALVAFRTEAVSHGLARWFDAIRAATAGLTEMALPSSDPAAVSVSAQAGWNRRALPLLLAFGVSDALMAWRSLALARRGPDALLVLFGVASAWYAVGFLQANRALRRGDLDAVTSDELQSPQNIPHDRPPGGPPSPVRPCSSTQ